MLRVDGAIQIRCEIGQSKARSNVVWEKFVNTDVAGKYFSIYRSLFTHDPPLPPHHSISL